MNDRARDARLVAWLFGLTLVLAAAGVARPLLPIDETRYAAVAWEMWARGDFLLPTLNGQPYHQKPPLLFWLMHAGWAVFGVQAWWPRLISPLFAAATLALTAALARRLWPARPDVARLAPAVLLSCVLFGYFASALMFDMMLACFVALGWLGLLTAWRDGARARGFVLLALGMGGALYAKGPVALVHLLVPALTAPWWMREQRPHWRRWYAGVALALLAGAVLILAWAVPAAIAGGPSYRDAIFWRQTAGRMADSFAHRAPWYFYVVSLPLILAPWFLWPRCWSALKSGLRDDSGVRFVVVVASLVLLLFSLFSGKRWHYLLPEFALFALLAARGLCATAAGGRWRLAVPALTLALFGAAAIAVGLGHYAGLDAPAALVGAGICCLLAGATLLALRPLSALDDAGRVAVATVVALAALMIGITLALREAYDLQPTAQALARYESEGRPVAISETYHGQWTFAGRLRRPLVEQRGSDAAAWLAAHPGGRFLFIYHRPDELPATLRVEESRRYRGGRLAILAAP